VLPRFGPLPSCLPHSSASLPSPAFTPQASAPSSCKKGGAGVRKGHGLHSPSSPEVRAAPYYLAIRPARSREAWGQRHFEDPRFRNLRQVSQLMAVGSNVPTACRKLQGAVLSLFLLGRGTTYPLPPALRSWQDHWQDFL